MALIEVRLRPTGPWRVGHRAGDRERVDVVYHSDALYSAITHAMSALGWLEEWLDATARAERRQPPSRFSSLFPFIGKTRLIAPPQNPRGRRQALASFTSKRTKLVPLEMARGGAIDESRWTAGWRKRMPGTRRERIAPFQVSVRSAAAVDRSPA